MKTLSIRYNVETESYLWTSESKQLDSFYFVILDWNGFFWNVTAFIFNYWYNVVSDGFHKIVSPDAGTMKLESPDEIKFTHPYFMQGHVYLLDHIKRKVKSWEFL